MPAIPRASYPLAWTKPQIVADLVNDGMDPAMANNIASTLNKIMQKQATDERLNYRVIEQGLKAKPYATKVVAAADSVASLKENADFICDGIGGVDDAVTINLAVAAAEEGGHVLLLEGRYELSSSIEPLADQWISGQGYGTLLDLDGDVVAIDSPTNGPCYVTELRIQGTSVTSGLANNTGDGVLPGGTGSLVERCWFESLDVAVGTAADYVRVVNCHFTDCNNAVHYTGSQGSIVSACTIRNDSNDPASSGVFIDSGRDCVIVGNSFHDDGTIGTAIKVGVSVAGQSGTGTRNIVTGNRIYGGSWGIMAGHPNTLVTDNYVSDCHLEGIWVGGDESVVHNNYIRDCSKVGDLTRDGIVVVSAERCSIQGNVIRYKVGTRHRYGINVGGIDNLVTNNDLLNSGGTASLNDTGVGTITTSGNRL